MTNEIPIEIHTQGDGTATVNGQLVHRGQYQRIHDAALAVAAGHAQAVGKPLLAKAIDGDGSVWWLNVHPDGRSFPVEPPQISNPEEEPKHRLRGRHTPAADLDETASYPPAAGAPDAPIGDSQIAAEPIAPLTISTSEPVAPARIPAHAREGTLLPEPEIPQWAIPVAEHQQGSPTATTNKGSNQSRRTPNPTPSTIHRAIRCPRAEVAKPHNSSHPRRRPHTGQRRGSLSLVGGQRVRPQ